MSFVITFLALLAPAVLCLAALVPQVSADPRLFARYAVRAASVSFGAGVAVVVGVWSFGPGRSGLIGSQGVGLSLYVDALSAIMVLLISFVGLAVIRYSRNYLDGDPGHIRFTRWLLLALASVEMLVISGNVIVLIIAGTLTSLSLGRLLLFYGDRPAAQRAAAKKFVASRIADLCLVVAAVLLLGRCGTLEIPDLMAAACSGAGTDSTAVVVAALLVVTAALLKSAQLPLHGWLLEVMETPTPVSALLHAGIINAGGFLVLRLADVLLLAAPALNILAIVGGATALFGSLTMLTQTSVKVQLACSTIAQMGFMLLQCGLGAFSSALLHIVAHSLYKAHAFLASGSVMDLARASWTPSPGGQPHPARLIVALSTVVMTTVGVAGLFGATFATDAARIAFGCILLMGLVHLLASAIDERPNAFVVTRAAVLGAGIAGLYFGLQVLMELIVGRSLPAGSTDGPVVRAIAALTVVSFAGVTIFQNQMMRQAEAPFWIAAYVHLKNGLYLNTLANRLVLALSPRRAAAKTY